MSRRCARPDCNGPALTTLSYDYDRGTVWLDELATDDHPMSHDLCELHADTLSVPRGWELRDRRPHLAAARAVASQPADRSSPSEGEHRSGEHRSGEHRSSDTLAQSLEEALGGPGDNVGADSDERDGAALAS